MIVFYFQYKAELVRSFTEQVLPHFQSTDPPLCPVIDSMFNMEDAEMAHQRMEANKNIGKIILKIGNTWSYTIISLDVSADNLAGKCANI